MNNEILSPPQTDYDVLCFSHLRWDFVYQRPQHLMSRFSKSGRVFVIEEPVFHDEGEPASLSVTARGPNIFIAVPQLPFGLTTEHGREELRRILDGLILKHGIRDYISWYYTPMMLSWSEHLDPRAIVYDCMDELSAFKNASPEIVTREAELFSLADLVFTGGQSLYEAKSRLHKSVFAFPSSIDVPHFARALSVPDDMPDQADISRPRIGYVGVIDERIDLELLDEIAELRPTWQFVMIGPVVKIDESSLPRRSNIHYLGSKPYEQLPDYISGWDVAIMPFAINDATRFISPTKTPEYLAAGRPVVSTPIRDVVRPYGENGLVEIASTPEEFVRGIEVALTRDEAERRRKADEFLSKMSWNSTFAEMKRIIDDTITRTRKAAAAAAGELGHV